MKKEELIYAIDSVQPDVHMKTRLSAKIFSAAPERKKHKRLAKCLVALCLAAAVVSGAGLLTETPPDGTEGSETSAQELVPGIMKGFIVIASAAETQGEETAAVNKTLELNEEYPYGVYLRAVDTRQLSEKDKKEVLNELNNELAKYCGGSSFLTGRSSLCDTGSCYLVQCSVNEFRLDLENGENIEYVNVSNTSEYGQMVYSTHKPTFNAPEHGSDITVSGEDFDCETDGFYWEHTEEMEKVLGEDINTSFSAFDDTVTFTVEYKDGTRAVGVVELRFDSTGSASAVCKNYEYQKAGD